MARLYSRMNAGAVDDPVHGHFEPDPDHGGFEFPDELSDMLGGFCHRGRPVWETEEDRSERLHDEDLARRRDPAMLYDAVGNFSGALQQLRAGPSPEVEALTAQVKALTERLAAVEKPPADAKPAAKAEAAAK
jgi:hypothetical protein